MSRPLRETSYQLVIEVRLPVRCSIGRLGTFDFAPGRYLYTGSATRGIDARIARHLRAAKTLRWHVDYLLAARGVRVVDVVRSRRAECALNRAVKGRTPVPGFGATDCRSGCGAHLKYLGAAGDNRVWRGDIDSPRRPPATAVGSE